MTTEQRNIASFFVLLFLCGIFYLFVNWSWFFGTAQQERAAIYICSYAKVVYDEPCEERWLIVSHMDELTTCKNELGEPDVQDAREWAECVEREGVILRMP